MKGQICGLDLGNKRIKICIGEEDEQGRINILTKISKEINSFQNGEIIDQELFIEEVIETLKEINQQLNEEPIAYILSFSNPSFVFQQTRGKVSVAGKYVSDDDLERLFSLAKASLVSSNLEILFEEPTKYFLDSQAYKVRDPLGIEARSLEVELSVIQGLKANLNKIKEFFLRNNLKIKLILPNPLPASFVLIPKREKEQGVILVDFGYRILSVTAFQEGKLIFYRNFKFGFGDIIEDIALDFYLPVNEIEKILMEIRNFSSDKKKFKIKINKHKLSYNNFLKIIEKKFGYYWKKENIQETFKELKEKYKLTSGIYLIGGGSFLPDIETIFKKYSGYPIKITSDIYQTLNEDERIFLNALGNIFYYQKNFSQEGFFEKIKKFFKSFLV
jgi:cell division protein FtsA